MSQLDRADGVRAIYPCLNSPLSPARPYSPFECVVHHTWVTGGMGGARLERATSCLYGAGIYCGLLPPVAQAARPAIGRTHAALCCALLRFAASTDPLLHANAVAPGRQALPSIRAPWSVSVRICRRQTSSSPRKRQMWTTGS